MKEYLKNIDWLLQGAILFLCAMSSLTLFAIDRVNGQSDYFKRQLIFILLGLIVSFIVSFFNAQIFGNYCSLIMAFYFLSLGLLVMVLIFGQKIRGTVGWFKVGPLNFEPVELTKIILILVLAKYFSGRHVELYRARHIFISFFYVFLPIALVLKQPDLGSSLILGAIWLGMVILSGIKLRHLFLVLLAGILVAIISWHLFLKPFQKERIISYLDPSKDPRGFNYNVNQAKIAIGSGGIFGKGLGRGTQGHLGFLPEKQTDFIFALIAEEWGFLGVVLLLSAFGLFFWRLISAAAASTNNFFRLLIAGFALMIFSQIVINVGMNLGLLPVTGISLPFLSYGGSNLLINFLALGIIQNIIIQSRETIKDLITEE